MPAVVYVDVSPEGQATVSVEGCPGPGCQQLTEAIEKAIGRTTQDVKTPDLYRSAPAQQAREQQL
jgi:hypothetical protein